MAGFVYSDGEAIVMKAIMDQEVLDDTMDHSIIFGKISASTSAIHQPCDVSPVFKGAKAILKRINNRGLNVSYPLIADKIRAAFNESEKSLLKNISSEKKNKIIHACLSIRYVLQEMLRPSLITQGFKDCGQWPLDYNTIMQQCYKELSLEELEEIKYHTDDDVQYFKQHGHLTEEQLDLGNIPTHEDDVRIPRDQRPLWNQRAALISHPETIARELDRINRGLPIGTALQDCSTPAERKELEKAIQIVKNDDKRIKKNEENRNKRALMTVEEKTAQKALQAEKREEKRRKTEEARALIASKNMEV